jgi:flavin reductase (DIM6/NTAB) family NADH-FMN oxidoreductase RutF
MAGGFERLMGRLDVPMVIVTTASRAGERSGCLVGFSSQASIHPGRYAVWISDKNHTHGVAADADHVAVHFPTPDAFTVAELFGSETGDEVDKFAEVAWTPGPGGVPLLDDVPDRFVGRVLDRVPTGDHTMHLLEPVEAWAPTPSHAWRQLGFQRTKPLEPGHDA